MLQKTTHLKIVDSTAADLAKTIHVFGGSGRKIYGRMSGLIRISVRKIKKLHATLKVSANRKHRILFVGGRRVSMITRVKRALLYVDGATLDFYHNGAITFNKRRKFGGKKFFGVTTRYVAYYKVAKKFKMQV